MSGSFGKLSLHLGAFRIRAAQSMWWKKLDRHLSRIHYNIIVVRKLSSELKLATYARPTFTQQEGLGRSQFITKYQSIYILLAKNRKYKGAYTQTGPGVCVGDGRRRGITEGPPAPFAPFFDHYYYYCCCWCCCGWYGVLHNTVNPNNGATS